MIMPTELLFSRDQDVFSWKQATDLEALPTLNENEIFIALTYALVRANI